MAWPMVRKAGEGGILTVALVAATAAFLPLGAQEITGDVADETGTPLASVAIGLFGADAELATSAFTDADGRFSIKAPAAGRYRIHLTRQGSRSISGGPYDLVVDVPLEVRVVMYRAPTALEPLVVEVQGGIPRLLASGFYQRQSEGFGHFLDRAEILRRGGMNLATALDRVPGVWVGRSSNLFGAAAIQNPSLVFRGAGVDCVPALWIDGSFVRSGGSQAPPLRLDDYVTVNDVAGVEFYGGPATAPIEFSHSGACSVVVIWTRGGERGSGDGR